MKRILGVVCCFVLTCSAWAQPLADRVPEDAMIYVGWCGADALPSSYDHTHLKAILDNSKLRELFTQFAPEALNLLATKEPNARAPIEVGTLLSKALWKHPTAIYFAGIDMADPQNPIPKLAIICKAGADAQAVRREIDNLLARVGDAPVSTFLADDFVVVGVGYRDVAQVMAGGAGVKPLKDLPAFKSALKQVQSESVFTVYADTEKLIKLIEAMTGANLEVSTKIQTVVDALGVRGIKRVIATCGFDREDWMSQCFVEAPMPRSGLLTLMDSTPISPDVLKAVPKDATFFATGRIDAAKAITSIRTAAMQIDPQAGKMVDMGLGAVQMALAKNLVTDILEPMGPDWAIYCSPSVAGNGLLGLVIVNKLDDPAKAQAALPVASINLSNWAATALIAAKAPVTVSGRMTKIDGMNVYYVGLPIVAPAWTMKDGYLYLALYPQTAASGARATAKTAATGSITGNEKFIALQKRLGVTNPRSISFYDLESTAANGAMYQTLQLLLRYAGFADMFGLQLPEPLMPPLDVLREHLGPAGSASWVDDAGFHSKSVSPFPGAKIFSEPGMMTGASVPVTGMMTAVLLPSLNRARETANRVKCASNMRQIGMAILLYSNENKGKYPATLSQLLRTQDITVEVFSCPSSSHEVPDAVRKGGIDAMAQWVDDDGAYIYVGAGMDNRAPADTIVLYEKPDNHDGDGMNLLFGDGHVEFQDQQAAEQLIAKQRPPAM